MVLIQMTNINLLNKSKLRYNISIIIQYPFNSTIVQLCYHVVSSLCYHVVVVNVHLQLQEFRILQSQSLHTLLPERKSWAGKDMCTSTTALCANKNIQLGLREPALRVIILEYVKCAKQLSLLNCVWGRHQSLHTGTCILVLPYVGWYFPGSACHSCWRQNCHWCYFDSCDWRLLKLRLHQSRCQTMLWNGSFLDK